MIDPFDAQALKVLEDELDLKCFCSTRPSDACPVHNGRGIIEALTDYRNAQAREMAEHEGVVAALADAEEDLSELRKAAKSYLDAKCEETERDLRDLL